MKARWLGAGLLAASTLALPMTAQAQDRWGHDDRYRDDQGYRDDYGRGRGYRSGTFSFGFDRGLSDGARRGERDARSRRGFDFRRQGEYRDADNGYRGNYGPRWEYSRGYREGYEQGYREAFRANVRRDRDDRYWDRGYRRY